MIFSKIVTFFANRKLLNAIKTANSIQRKTLAEIESFQNKKFEKFISHVKNNVRYYDGKLDNVFEVGDITRVPILGKEDVRKYGDELKATNLPQTRFVKNSTSGSTGDSMHFFSDAENNYNKAANIRGDQWAGLNYGERSLYFWGAERDIEKNKSLYKKIKHRFIVKNKIISTYHMSDKDLSNYVDEFNVYKPSVIVSYPTPLFHLAQYIEKNKSPIFRPKGIITSAEMLFPFQREKIEKVFSAKVFNRYGCREVGHIAAECSQQNGLHINIDRFILEVVDVNGNPCKPGELGEIVITDLDNYVFPLIRYKIGDLGILSDRSCSCGINLPMLERVEGRVFDLVVGVNGNTVAGTFWTLLRNKIKGFKKFQVIQEKEGFVEIIVEKNKEIEPSFTESIAELVKEKLGDEMQVSITLTDKIPLTKTGKHRWIISKISPHA